MSVLEMLNSSFSFCEEQRGDEEIRAHKGTHRHKPNLPVEAGGASHPKEVRNVLEFSLPVLCPPRVRPDTL